MNPIRYSIVLFLLVLISGITRAQQITYDIPAHYQKDITIADYKRIVDAAVPIIAKQYKIDSVSGGAIYLHKGQDMQGFNLDNLLLKCVTVKDKKLWDQVIREHFENLFDAVAEQKKIDPDKFETITKYLSIRIYPVETVEERGGAASVVSREDLEGTYSLLMLDLPGAFVPVQKKVFDGWKKNNEEVFAIAQANINKQRIDKVTNQFDIEGSKIEISFLGNEDYAASYALDLPTNSPEFVGAWGSAIAIPTKGLVNICKISKEKPVDFVKFIQYTKHAIDQAYQGHPQPISDQYFWYYKGKFTRIKVITNPDGGINVISPAGLTELMTQQQ